MKKIFTRSMIAASLTASLLLTGCASDKKNTGKGVAVGAGTGAVLGGIIGHQSGNREKGAIIGGVLGGGLGGVIGRRMDNQAKELEQVAETKRTEEGLVAQLKSDILFDTGKSTVKPEAKESLKKMAEIMRKYPENVLTIKGYTDSTGSDQINDALSEDRAEAVRALLVQNNLPADVITTRGFGEDNPVASNDTASGRKQNRRVEIEVTVDESKVPTQTR